METLPKIVDGCSRNRVIEEKSYKHCNICRNFQNVCDRNHRNSKTHQMKLSGRFEIIKSKMKMIRLDSITAHDERWETEASLYCYFCDKAVKMHQTFNGFMIEYLGYLTHLTESSHMEAVNSYLKHHGRKEKFNVFCKTQDDLKRFMEKVHEAENKYMAKLTFLDQEFVKQIKDTEAERQKIVQETFQFSFVSAGDETKTANNEHYSQLQYPQSTTSMSQSVKRNQKSNSKFSENPKVPPWQIPRTSSDCNVKQRSDCPVIGPTMETFTEHVSNQKKKGLPAKRVGANFKRGTYSSNWLPAFGGVWNKGRHRKLKPNFKNR